MNLFFLRLGYKRYFNMLFREISHNYENLKAKAYIPDVEIRNFVPNKYLSKCVGPSIHKQATPRLCGSGKHPPASQWMVTPPVEHNIIWNSNSISQNLLLLSSLENYQMMCIMWVVCQNQKYSKGTQLARTKWKQIDKHNIYKMYSTP